MVWPGTSLWTIPPKLPACSSGCVTRATIGTPLVVAGVLSVSQTLYAALSSALETAVVLGLKQGMSLISLFLDFRPLLCTTSAHDRVFMIARKSVHFCILLVFATSLRKQMCATWAKNAP